MVLSSRVPNAEPSRGLAMRTLIYVASFGVGSLLVAALLSVVLVSVAEGLLPAGAAPSEPDSSAEPADSAAAPRLEAPRRRRPLQRPSKGNALDRSGQLAPTVQGAAAPGEFANRAGASSLRLHVAPSVSPRAAAAADELPL